MTSSRELWLLHEHEQVIGIIRAKNRLRIELDPRRTALILVDMQRYFSQRPVPFTEIFDKLSLGSPVGFLKRVRETRDLEHSEVLDSFRVLSSSTLPVRTKGAGASCLCWLRSFDELGLVRLANAGMATGQRQRVGNRRRLEAATGRGGAQRTFSPDLCYSGLEQRLRHQGVEAVVW